MLRSPTHHHHHHHHHLVGGGGVVVGHGPTSTGSVVNGQQQQQQQHQMSSTTQSAAAQATIVAGGVGVGGRSIFKMNGFGGGGNITPTKTINNNFNHLHNNNNHHQQQHIPMTTSTPPSTPINQSPPPPRTSLFDSCHRKIRLIGGGPFVFLGGLVAKARRKDRDGEQNQSDTKLYLEESVLERKLPDADLKDLVDLPSGLDYNEWLASHTLALFEHVNLVYGTISEFCTTSTCPDMTGPGTRMYLWFDEKGKKTRVAAPQYIDYVMTFTQKTVSDEQIFPTKYANEFPTSFEMIARKILRLLFHVIAHLYAGHFREIALLGLHTHLNLTFAHLTALHRKFNLIDSKETEVLRDLELALRLTDNSSIQTTTGGTVASTSTSLTTTTTTIATATNSSASDYMTTDEQQQQQHNNYLCQTIDGDATIQPIVTQPESASLLQGATQIIHTTSISTGTNYQPFNHSCHQHHHQQHHHQHHNQPYLYSDSNNCETGGGNCGGGIGCGNGGNGAVIIGGINNNNNNNYGVVIGGGTGSPLATLTQQQQQPQQHHNQQQQQQQQPSA